MKFRTTLLSALTLLSLSFVGISWGEDKKTEEKPRKLPITFKATVDYVVDGDSVRVWLVDEEALFLISIYGVDAPELPQPYGSKARDFVIKTLKNKKLKVKIVQTGEYQTGLGYFMLEGKDLGTILVNNGFAEVDEKTIRQFRDKEEMGEMLKLEKTAREEKAGMWVQGDDYESPVTYMMRTRKKSKKGGGKH